MRKRTVKTTTKKTARAPVSRPEIVKLGAKGRVVIPAAVRRRLGLKKGDSLMIDVEGKRLVIASRLARLEALEKELGLKPTPPGRSYVDEMNAERDAEAAAE